MRWGLFFELLTVMLGVWILGFPILCMGVTALRFGGGAEWFVILIYISILAAAVPLHRRADLTRRQVLLAAAGAFVAFQLALGLFIMLPFYNGIDLLLVIGSQALLMLLVAYFTPRRIFDDSSTDRAPDTSPHP
jgi:putative effector of murein hydrolase